MLPQRPGGWSPLMGECVGVSGPKHIALARSMSSDVRRLEHILFKHRTSQTVGFVHLLRAPVKQTVEITSNVYRAPITSHSIL